ncbi:hypothetical protein TD95_002879 [Thielaviopsis punctulata]|uniref:Protein-S-isoprenylcysteine O-methyltransferase n=1 Tax=Thielaviopsis punctulata TaxID=72032 RepID=A0A0F4ZDY3_9PEZI|nr:hypothetical protein TD95_002879 [Thielaviopsis punctulata]
MSGIAFRAFCLGLTLSLAILLIPSAFLFLPAAYATLWRVPFFLAALSAFHFLEFWTTARYNTPAADVSSFLLTANWPLYAIAHAAAFVECAFTNAVFPYRPWGSLRSDTAWYFCAVGLAFTLIGQIVRSLAMIQCGRSFNHTVQRTRAADHKLVTHKIYSVLRHPSYFGFFWWAVGTQLAMGNVICLIAYVVVLWTFFSSRIRFEEHHLVEFFGEEYVEYRRRVKVWIPLIR